MRVIAANTEQRLLDDLQRYGMKHKDQCCMLLNLAETDICKNMLFEHFLELIHNMPSYYLARIYLFQDKDIIIKAQGFMQRHFFEFFETLSQVLGRTDILKRVYVFDIEKNKQRLHDVCIEKMKQKDELLKDIDTPPKIINPEALARFSPDDVARIHKRRDNRTRPLVMIADDNQLCRLLAINALRSDYDIITSENGQHTLTEYVTWAPDILFLDIGLPDIHGHDVLELLFRIDPKAHVIMFSGQKDKATILKSLELGAEGFLEKPFTRDQLRTHVERMPKLEQILLTEQMGAL